MGSRGGLWGYAKLDLDFLVINGTATRFLNLKYAALGAREFRVTFFFLANWEIVEKRKIIFSRLLSYKYDYMTLKMNIWSMKPYNKKKIND